MPTRCDHPALQLCNVITLLNERWQALSTVQVRLTSLAAESVSLGELVPACFLVVQHSYSASSLHLSFAFLDGSTICFADVEKEQSTSDAMAPEASSPDRGSPLLPLLSTLRFNIQSMRGRQRPGWLLCNGAGANSQSLPGMRCSRANTPNS